MTRFYFEIHDGNEVFPDKIGEELASPQAARDVATSVLFSVSVPLAQYEDRRELAVYVRDENGLPSLTVRLRLSTEWAT